MAADGPLERMWDQRRSVRVRTTLLAVVVVGVTLIVTGVVVVRWLDRSLTQSVERSALISADHVADFLDSSGTVGNLPGDNEEDEYVQLLDTDGNVVDASQNVEGFPAFATPEPGDTERVLVRIEEDEDDPDEKEPFLAVAVDHRDQVIVIGRTLEAVDESVDVLIGILAVGLPLLLLVMGFVTWVVVGRALEPVEAIRKEVEDISTEELHRRVPTPATDDEIARLAVTMNQMLERLEAGQERQRRFVSDASHELRSPVATVRQHAEVVLAHPESSSAEDLARIVLDENLRLQQLVEDLLILARTDENAARSKRTTIDVDDLVFEEIRRLREVAGKTIDASKVSAGRVRGDAKQLTRLISNLLDNAVRHATHAVQISLEEHGDEVVLRVDDDGGGVAADEKVRIFERFVRLEEARDRDSGGAGLGLAIVAEVARGHGGKVEVLDGPAGGARFEVRLPRYGA